MKKTILLTVLIFLLILIPIITALFINSMLSSFVQKNIHNNNIGELIIQKTELNNSSNYPLVSLIKQDTQKENNFNWSNISIYYTSSNDNGKYPSNDEPIPFCGDGIINQNLEECDGEDGVIDGFYCTDECKLEEIEEEPGCIYDVAVRYTYSESDNTGIRIGYLNNTWIKNTPVIIEKNKTYKIKTVVDNKLNESVNNVKIIFKLNNTTITTDLKNINKYVYSEIEFSSYELSCGEYYNINILAEKDNCVDLNPEDNYAQREIFIFCEPDEEPEPFCGDGIINQNLEECDGEDGVIDGFYCTDECKLEEIEKPICEHDVAIRYSYSNSFGTGIAIKQDGGDWISDKPAELLKGEDYKIKYYIDNKIPNTTNNINVKVKLNNTLLYDYNSFINVYHFKELDLDTSCLECNKSHIIYLEVDKINETDCNMSNNYAQREIFIFCEADEEPEPEPEECNETFEINLNKKWNLISVPFRLKNDSIEEVFSEISEDIEVILSYYNEKWYSYYPETLSEIEKIKPGYGYWVKAKKSTNLKLTGCVLLSEPEIPLIRSLDKGVNLIGHYGTQEKTAYCALFSLVDTQQGFPKWNALNSYNSDTQEFFEINNQDIMHPGKAYWISVEEKQNYSPVFECY